MPECRRVQLPQALHLLQPHLVNPKRRAPRLLQQVLVFVFHSCHKWWRWKILLTGIRFNPWSVMHKEICIPVRKLCMTTMHCCIGWLSWRHTHRLCNEKRVCRYQEHHRVALLALPQHQHSSFLCPDVLDRIALSFFKKKKGHPVRNVRTKKTRVLVLRKS